MTARDRALAQQGRWDRMWRMLLLPLLAVATAAALADASAPVPSRLVTLGLAAALGAWHWWMIMAHPQWPERSLWPMTVYFAGLLGFAWLLTARDPAYGLVMTACLPMAFVALPGRSAYAGVACAILVVFDPLERLAQGGSPAWLLPAAGSMVACGFLGWLIRSMESAHRGLGEANRELARVNTELAEANARLTRLGEENAELSARLLAGARETGVAGERARMAREIHDTVAQGLTGIVTQLEAAAEAAGQESEVRRRLAVARELARESLTEARRSVRDLRPGPLASTRLPDALTGLVERWSAVNEVPATMTITGTPRLLHPEVEITVLRSVQEALANVARHAGARRAGVTLSYMEDVIVADIRDDGAGFSGRDGDGFGLTAMRQRARRLAGGVQVESAPGQGTAVSVTVPAIPSPAAAGAQAR
ncbi:sensor histidine kinase [Spongiactinospora sp. 9N601]|uniref:sensor histidine kinase n=1 Tax=Spongiactinospora sp. 9N601 TaxID=3375149 RepID=UPI0037A3EADB